MSRSTRWIVVAIVLALVVVLLAPFVWSEITTRQAPPQLGLETSGEPSDTVEPPTPGPFEVDGTWVVEAGSESGFRVQETGPGATEEPLVGSTDEVTGSVTVRSGEAVSVEITTRTASITTGDPVSDLVFYQALEVDAYPAAIFTLTTPMPVDELAGTTEPVELVASGTLTLRDVTASVDATVEAQRSGDGVQVTAAIPVRLADYELSVPPDLPVQVAPDATVEVRLQLVRAAEAADDGAAAGG
ncbi:YceI family protein [Cellulosimicrobium terreum]|nr:YceI family protein [Cellulosimicrobium terreum]